MADTVLTLIVPSGSVQDDEGVWRDTGEATREIYAAVDSVNRNEFFSAGQAGFRPELRFTVFAGEYQGELLCEYDGMRYAIYRTYHVAGTDWLELYAQREVGVQRGT